MSQTKPSPQARRRRVERGTFDLQEFCNIILNTIVMSVWITDKNDTAVYANQGALDLAGLPRDQFVDLPILKSFPEEARQFQPLYEQARQTLQPLFVEAVHLISPSGRETIQSGWLVPLTREGRFDGMIGVFNNITDRWKSEEALKLEKERFRKYLDIAGLIFVAIRADERVEMINKKGCRILGYREEEIIGQNWFDLIIPERTRKDVRKVFRQLLAEERPQENYFENSVLSKDGTERRIAWHNTFLTDERGRVIGTLISGEDITSKRAAEDALRESEEKYRQLFELESDAIFLIDNETGNILEANTTASETYGYSREELLSRKDTDLSDEPEKTRNIILSGETWVPLRWHRKKDGTSFPVEIAGRHFTWRGQRVHIASIRDITKRLEAEEAMMASLREKEVLLKEIHHRVKNNMQIISSLLNLQSRDVHDPEIAEILRESQSRIRSMALAHEKLYQSQHLSHIDFSDYIKSLAVHLFQINQINPDLIKLKVESEGVYFDIQTAIPCGLILNELVTNALKHAFPKGERGGIVIELYPLRKHVFQLVVKDDGQGMSKDIDVKNPKSFGLQIVDMLVSQLEGTIDIKRKPGTSFTIVFKEMGYKSRL